VPELPCALAGVGFELVTGHLYQAGSIKWWE